MTTQYADYLIVGAGSTGVHLASTLAEKGYNVVVLDSANKLRSPFYLTPPIFASFLLENKKYAEVFQAESQSGLNKRHTSWFSSRLLGGLAEMNGAVCFAGHKDIYLDAFKSTMTDYQAVVEKLCEINNPFTKKLYTSRKYAWNSPISDEFKSYWGQGNGYDVDFDRVLLGSGQIKNNRKKYGRFTSSERFRNHVISGSIRYINQSRVNSLAIKDGFVTGVVLEDGQSVMNVRAKKVVLCAGVIGSPEILLRSGIGNSEELKRAAIDLKVDLPGVGKNLSDHPNFRIPFFSEKYKRWSICNKGRNVAEALRYAFGFNSYFGSSGASCAANFTSNVEKSIGDIVRMQLVHFSLSKSDDRGTFAFDKYNNFSLSISLLAPLSRGYVSLSKERDLMVNPGYLRNKRDIENLEAGLEKALIFIKAINGVFGGGASINNKTEREIYIRNNVNTGYHMVGTCSMGDDPMKYVCNNNLSVKRMENLYVCDASVFPSQVSSNTYMPCLMLADYFVAMNA